MSLDLSARTMLLGSEGQNRDAVSPVNAYGSPQPCSGSCRNQPFDSVERRLASRPVRPCVQNGTLEHEQNDTPAVSRPLLISQLPPAQMRDRSHSRSASWPQGPQQELHCGCGGERHHHCARPLCSQGSADTRGTAEASRCVFISKARGAQVRSSHCSRRETL